MRHASNRAGRASVPRAVKARDLVLGAACVVAALAPALAYGEGASSASFTAVDYGWRANDSDAASLTIAPGEAVTFAYPSGVSFHDAHFADPQPVCQNLPSRPQPKGWTGTCTFPDAGTYRFVCDAHASMTGQVVVEAPMMQTPTPTPTVDGPPPAAAPAPTPVAVVPATGVGQTSPKGAVKLAVNQRGTRVRGTVALRQPKSRLEVTLTARLKPDRARVRIGRWVNASAASGSVSFSVPLNASARRVLRREHALAVTVTVALTPPGASTLNQDLHAQLRSG
jgi:plastocyanin